LERKVREAERKTRKRALIKEAPSGPIEGSRPLIFEEN